MVSRPTTTQATTQDERERLLLLADLTLAEFLRHRARPDGTVFEEDGLVLFAGPHPQPSPFRNGAIRLDARLPAEEAIRRASEFFAARRRGFVMWVREHADEDLASALQDERVRELERIPGMVLEGLPDERPLPEGIELRRARTADERRDLLRVTADAWGLENMPLDAASDVFFHPDMAAAPQAVAFLAYSDEEPVASSMAFASHGVGLGCEGATLPSHRGKGLAHITQRAALKVCMDELGAKQIFAQTSQAGLRVWTSFGFVPFTGYRRLIVPLPGSGAPG